VGEAEERSAGDEPTRLERDWTVSRELEQRAEREHLARSTSDHVAETRRELRQRT
jgi:hypothetical protein